jgi:superfamily II DNA or RNA helicase
VSFELRPYQKDAIMAINEHWEEWKKELLVLPTGCGKTVVFNEIARQKAPGVLILAHRDELIEQARQKYGEPTGKIKADENSIMPVTVGSVQTMCRRSYEPDLFSTIIVDEAHHAVSPSYQGILSQFPDAKVLGVTATADRGDKKSLGQYFEGIAYEYKLKQAVNEGWLCSLSARTVPIDIDLSEVNVSVGDFEVNSIAETLEPYLPEIAKAIVEYAGNRKTVVFLPLVGIAQRFRDELLKAGLNAREVNGASPDRKETLSWFDQAGPGSVLCNAMLLTEGWDCPSVDCVVVLRPTKVRSLYTQMIGRGTRLYPGKKDLLILDFLWLCQKHNLCKPSHLVTDQEEDQRTVSKRSESEEIDLFGALTDAEEQRKIKLAEELRKQSKKKSKLINPLELFDLLDDIGLADYEPSFKWEESEATQKQVQALENFGIDAEGVTKGYACRIMDTMIGRAEQGLATMRQIRLLKDKGFNHPETMTFQQASNCISYLASCGWKPWKYQSLVDKHNAVMEVNPFE